MSNMRFHCTHCGVDYYPVTRGSVLCPVCHNHPAPAGGGYSSAGGAADTNIDRMRRDWADAERRLNEKYVDALIERDTIKAKLAEVEAERDECVKVHDENINLMREFQKLMSQCANELEREREAVKSLSDQLEWSLKNEAQYKNAMKKAFEVENVMRKALEQIQSLAANEHEQGDSKALDDVLDLTCETFKALAKADEIRGGE